MIRLIYIRLIYDLNILIFSFYINLRGKVSIYINHKKYDENDNVDDTEIFSKEESENDININHLDAAKNKRIREKLGNYVTSLGK
jgi:hypothetical protein